MENGFMEKSINEKGFQATEETEIHFSVVVRSSEQEATPETSCTTIDKFMVPAKMAYIFKLAIYDKLLFSMLFYLSIGLSPVQAGLVNGLQHIGGLLGAPAIGLLADKTKAYKLIALTCCLLAVLANVIQPMFSFFYGNQVDTLFCVLLPSAVAASAFETSAISFVDSGVLQRMKYSPNKPSYGIQRLFGTIGQAGGSISNSLAVTYFPCESMSPYTGLFVTYTVFGVSLLITSYYLLDNSHVNKKNETKETSKGNLKVLMTRALKNPDNVIFFVNVFLNGCMQALLFTFTYVYMKEFNAPTLVFGLGMTFAAASAFVTYICSTWLLKKMGGPENAFCVAWFSMGIRLFTIAYMCRWNPFLIIVPELLQGPTYSLFWVSSIEYIDKKCHPSILTTMCGIVNSLFNPCSYLVANVLGSKLYDLVGGETLFLGSGVFCFAWTLLSCGYVYFKSRRSRSYEEIM